MIAVLPKKLEGKQCAIVWYVIEKKASHLNPKVIDKMISYLKIRFVDLSTTRGKNHSFMVINIEIKK